jgi:hypothetical protein
VSAIEERGDFEPPALPSDVSLLREAAFDLVRDELTTTAHDSMSRQEVAPVAHLFKKLKENASTEYWFESTCEAIVLPTTSKLEYLCDEIRTECGTGVTREDGEERSNLEACRRATDRYRREVGPLLSTLLQLGVDDQHWFRTSKEVAARCLQSLAVNFTWADAFDQSEKLYLEAKALAGGGLLGSDIEEGLNKASAIAKQKRLISGLTPISSAPSLFTFNGFGFAIYGNTDYDHDSRSYVTVHYFTALFFPIFPIARYRVIADTGNRYRFLGKLPLRTFDRVHLWGALACIAALIFWGSVEDQKTSSAYRGASANSTSARPTYPAPSQSQISTLKSQIDEGRSRHAAIITRLAPILAKLEAYQKQLKSLKEELATLDAKSALGSGANVSYYNSRVDLHNSVLSNYRNLLAANQTDIDSLEELEQSDARLVAQYNSLVKR